MGRPRERRSGCCSFDFIKLVLHIFNVVILIAGLLVLGVGIWTYLDRFDYVVLLISAAYPTIVYFLIAAGALAAITSIIGFFAVAKDNKPLILTYSFLLLLVFLIEVMVGAVAFVYREHVHEDLTENLNVTFSNSYGYDEEYTNVIDTVQEKFACCGVVNYSHWAHSKWKVNNVAMPNLVPDSCCKTITENCGMRDHPNNIYYVGCMDLVEQHLLLHLCVLCAVSLGISVIQIFGMTYGFRLYMQYKDFKPIKGIPDNIKKAAH